MTQLNVLDGARGERGGYKVNVDRGERIGRVSSETSDTFHFQSSTPRYAGAPSEAGLELPRARRSGWKPTVTTRSNWR
jgi:hypothetical protein